MFDLDEEYKKVQWKEMVVVLQDMYEDLANHINGDHEYVSFDASNQTQVIPLVSGSSTPGTGTYADRVVYHVRKGLETQMWFDIEWTGHTGAGDLIVNLPYEVASSELMPFVGVLEIHNITLSSGYTYATVSCQPSTFDGLIHENGSAQPTQPIALSTSGRIKGYVSYIGKEFD